MQKLSLLVILIVSSILTKESYSQMSPFNGENLFNICNNEKLACRAFIVAVVDTTVLNDAAERIECSSFKIPKSITLDELKDIIIENLSKNPKKSQQSGVFSVISILHNAFPCS